MICISMLIIVVALIGYSNSFYCSFHFDDFGDIVENQTIRNISQIDKWWNHAPSRAVAMATFVLNYHIHQLDVVGYHVVNLLIHIINSMLVAWFVVLTFRTPMLRWHSLHTFRYHLAGLAGLLFVAHPIQTQAVTYIVQRMASLATLFYLTSIVCYITARFRERIDYKAIVYLGLASISAVLGMYTKQITFTLPFAILLYEYAFMRDLKINLRIPKRQQVILAILGFSLLLIIPAQMNFDFSVLFREIQPQQGHAYSISGPDYLLTQFSVIVTYIRLLIVPILQRIDHDFPIAHNFFSFPTWFNFGILLGLNVLAVKLFHRQRLLSFGIFWFFIALSIESSMIPIPNVYFEHRLYLPMVGFCIVFVALSGLLLQRFQPRYVWTVGGLVIITFMTLTFQRNKVWLNEETLWSDVIEKSPTNARAWNNRGHYRMLKEEYAEAISDFTQAFRLNPYFHHAMNNRGLTYFKQNMFAEALKDFNTALYISGQSVRALNNRGLVYYNLDQHEKALADYNKALQIKPDFTRSLNNRGVLYLTSLQFEKAIADLQKVLNLDPYFADAYNNLGVIYREQKEYQRAGQYFTKAIELDPTFIRGLINRGVNYQLSGKHNLASADFSRSLALDPLHPDALFNRSSILLDQKKYKPAITDLTTLLGLYPDSSAAWYNRGVAYKELGDFKNAIADFNQAVVRDSLHIDALTNRGATKMGLKLLSEATEDFNKAVKLAPNEAKVYENRGFFFAQTGKYDHALADFANAIKLDSNYLDAYNNRGNTYAILRQHDKAIADFTQALRIDSTYTNARFNRAVCLYHQKQYELAMTDVIRCQQLGMDVNPKFKNTLQNRLNNARQIKTTHYTKNN